MSHITFSPAAAAQALLTQKTIPALDEMQYQHLADYLFSAGRPLPLQVAETVFRYNRQHPHALGLFLACAIPLAKGTARRLANKIYPPPPDLTQELMYDGAVNHAIRMFQNDQLPDPTNFESLLHLVLKQGAMKAAFGRMENTEIQSFDAKEQCPPTPRIEEQLIAKEILEKIANLQPSPDITPRVYRILQCILEIGPSDALKPTHYRGTERGKYRLMIDLKPVTEKLQISTAAAKQYVSLAREILRQTFNQDGTLFTRNRPSPKKR